MTWPRPYHPINDDGAVDTETTVQVYAHEPGGTDALITWAGGEQVLLNGGPVVILPGHRRSHDRLVGLGDVAVKPPDESSPVACPGGALGSRYVPAGSDDAPPAD